MSELAPIIPKQALIGTFHGLKGPTEQTVLRLKIIMFFSGLIVKELTEHFRAEHGETRGGDHRSDPAQNQSGKASVLPAVTLESYLEDALGVTARTCRNHRSFWEACTTSDKHAKAVKALNGVWKKHVESLALEAPKKGKSAPAALALQDTCTELANAVEGLLEEADALDLHTLFEKPVKDVTPPAEPETEEQTADRKAKAIEFIDQLCRKLGGTQKTYLYAPKPHRERLLTELEEAASAIKQTLNPKAPRK